MEKSITDLDREIDLLLATEKEIETHRMRAISERVAFFLAGSLNLSLVKSSAIQEVTR